MPAHHVRLCRSPRDMALMVTTERRDDGAIFSAACSVNDERLPPGRPSL